MLNRNFTKTIALKVYELLRPSAKKRLKLLVSWQILVNLLDLVGVISIAALASLSLANGNSEKAGFFTSLLTSIVGSNVSIVLIIIILSFVLKTLLSIVVTQRILQILSEEFTNTSSRLIAGLFTEKQVIRKEKTKQELLYLCTRGVEFMHLQVLAPSLNILTDTVLLILLLLGALIISPFLTLLLVLIFGVIIRVLNLKLGKKLEALGTDYTRLTIDSDHEIMEAQLVQKEILLAGAGETFLKAIMARRNRLGQVIAKTAFMPFISKYLVESGVIIGAAVMGIASTFVTDRSSFLIALAVFLGIGTRITPAVLRIQQSLQQIKNHNEITRLTLATVETFFSEENLNSNSDFESITASNVAFKPELQVNELSFKYQSHEALLGNISINIVPGSTVAIVGSSGAGKTTLMNLMLGFLAPLSGTVLMSGITPGLAIQKWPGCVSLVPQEIHILSSSLAENIALGVPASLINLSRVESLIDECELVDFLSTLPSGLSSQIGEKGVAISGGQRQRIGIARALYSNPKLLFLDESTSSLDSVTENLITKKLFSGSSSRTTVVIAHRLSTIQNADTVIFLGENGHFDSGTFDEIRSRNRDFNSQANILGI